jgi:N,N'-diacetyllegionaminate synthase
MKTIVIAEIGVNHNGSVFKAKKLIDIAKKASADFVKFQSYIPDEIVTKDLPKLNYQKNKNKKESMKQLLSKFYFNFNLGIVLSNIDNAPISLNGIRLVNCFGLSSDYSKIM